MKKFSPPKAKAVQDGVSDDGVTFPTQSEVSPFEHLPASSSEFISDTVSIKEFLSSQLTHKTVNLLFTITNKTLS